MPRTRTPAPPAGPLQAGPGARFFRDPAGQPAFFLGDTEWELFRLYSRTDALRLLQRRRDQGFNVILVMLTGVDMAHIAGEPGGRYANLEGEEPWVQRDPSRPNERYYRHVDQLISLGQRTGQTLVVGVFHQWHVELFPLPVARAWARWVAERYRGVNNLIWSMYPRASAEYIPICCELAAGLQEGDGGTHQISVHPDPSVASSSFIHDEPWLAFNMIQTCVDYDRIVEAVTADYRRRPAKPAVMAEGGYEGLEFGRLQTAHHIRKQAYWTALSGGHFVYGHNDAWLAPGLWREWSLAPGAAQMRVFRQVLTSLPAWWELQPAPGLLAEGAGEGYARNAAARSAAGDWLLVYLSEPSTVTLREEEAAVRHGWPAEWIDPRDGSHRPAQAERGSRGSFAMPGGLEDALLLLSVR